MKICTIWPLTEKVCQFCYWELLEKCRSLGCSFSLFIYPLRFTTMSVCKHTIITFLKYYFNLGELSLKVNCFKKINFNTFFPFIVLIVQQTKHLLWECSNSNKNILLILESSQRKTWEGINIFLEKCSCILP